MDRIQLAQKLRDARENRGLRQDEAAEALGLPRTAIVKIEAGERSVSTFELAALANLYSRTITEFFAGYTPEEDDLLVALYRLAPGLKEPSQTRREVLRVMDICRDGVALTSLLGSDPQVGPPSYRPPSPRNAMTAVNQGTMAAEAERERLGLGKAPAGDLAELISSQGVWASGASLPPEMSGLFIRHSSIGMAILVNQDHTCARKRFSLAHEYAHTLLDRDRSVTISTRDNSDELIEKRANAFAAAFLMPRAGVETQLSLAGRGLPSRQDQPVYSVADDRGIASTGRPPLGSQDIGYQDVAAIAHHFGVSYQAAAYRLQSLDAIKRRECEALLEKEGFGTRYVRLLDRNSDREEAGSPRGERDDGNLVRQVGRLAVEAYRREEISRGRLLDVAKRLALDGKKLLELAEAARRG
jgi:Zn-dependent peptidase ImmA (M78 family)/transcriptional regulator with XRE-family HTH domain